MGTRTWGRPPPSATLVAMVVKRSARVEELLATAAELATEERQAFVEGLAVELTGFTNSLLWHERTQEDPARRWIRDVIVAEAAERSRSTTAGGTRSRPRQGPKAKPRRTIA
jgi:hypothetical protein